MAQLGTDRPAAEEGDPAAGDGGLLGRLHEAHLEDDVQALRRQAGAAQVVLDHHAHAGAVLLQDVGLGGDLLQGHPLAARPGVLRAADEDDLVAGEGLGDEVGTGRHRAHGAELELARQHALDHRVGVVDVQGDAHAGVLTLERREEAGQDVLAGTGRGAHHDLAGQQLAEVDDLRAQAVVQVHDLARVPVEHLSRVGRRHRPPRAVEEHGPELALEAPDLLAGGRLGDVELVGGE